MKVLLVDDDADLLGITSLVLRREGFRVAQAGSVATALSAFRRDPPDLVVLDINLPDGSGFDVCMNIRSESQVPVIMLTVRGEEADLVRALELGADDYVTKPFSPRTLVARMRALIRRVGAEATTSDSAGELRLDRQTLTLYIGDDQRVRLTRLEFRFLQLLLSHAGEVVPAEHVLAHVWGRRANADRHILKQLVHRLRQKLDGTADPGYIETVPAVGYRLRLQPAADA